VCAVRAVATPTIRARWSFDCKYGTKVAAIALLQEWVQEIGRYAEPGLDEEAGNARIHSGNIGAPESRLELEVEFGSLDELERFWGSIDGGKHMIWSEKIREVLIDGSPQWEVYRSVDPFASTGTKGQYGGQKSVGQSGILRMASVDDVDKYAKKSFGSTMKAAQDMMAEGGSSSDDGKAATEEEEEDTADKGRKIVLDWKGDPMVINPGDKLPFSFD